MMHVKTDPTTVTIELKVQWTDLIAGLYRGVMIGLATYLFVRNYPA